MYPHMGQEAAGALTPGEAWRVYTGGALPLGADAVLMQERALVVEPPLEGQRQNSGEHAGAHIAALAPCCSGENILAAGADMGRSMRTLTALSRVLRTVYVQPQVQVRLLVISPFSPRSRRSATAVIRTRGSAPK